VDEDLTPSETFEALGEVDVSAPETTIDSGPSGATADNVPSFAFSSEAGATFECSLDPGGSWERCGSPKSYNDVGEGPHTFSVRATDVAGNTDPSPASREFSVEGTTEPSPPISLPPAISLPPPSGSLDATPPIEPLIADVTSPETGIDKGPRGRIYDRTPTFRFSSSEVDSELHCKIDGNPFRLCASPYALRKLDFGRHVFAVRGIDVMGNVDRSPDIRRFRVAPRR
jgi:hypothetical protein